MFRIILLSIFLTGCQSMYKSAVDLHQYRTDTIGRFVYGDDAAGKPVIGPNGEYLGVVNDNK